MTPTTQAGATSADETKTGQVAVPAPGTEERDFWIEAAIQHGFEEARDEEYLSQYDPPALLASEDQVLALIAAARQQGRDDVAALASPAVVPESVRRLSFAEIIQQRWDTLVGPAHDAGSIGWKRHEFCREFAQAISGAIEAAAPRGEITPAAYAYAVETWGDVWVENEADGLRKFGALIADATPSGRAAEGGEDDTHRCGICDKPLIEGQMVLIDVEIGEVHANCCGPERDSYVKNIETGEPLGPNDPIPAGRPYVAPTPPASAGDVDGDLTALANAASVAERAYGILWRLTAFDTAQCGYAHDARKVLLAAMDKEGQRRGIAWATRQYGPLGPNPKFMLSDEDRMEMGL